MKAAWAFVFIGLLVSTVIKVDGVVMGQRFSFPLLAMIWVVLVLVLVALILRLVREFAETGWGCRVGRPAVAAAGGSAPRPRPQQYRSRQQYQPRPRQYQPRPRPRPVGDPGGYPDDWPPS